MRGIMENKKFRVTYRGKEYQAEYGERLARVIGADEVCGGHGKCGKCKVIAKYGVIQPKEADLKLTEEERALGVVYSCLAEVVADAEILPLSPESGALSVLTDGDMPDIALSPIYKALGAAVDIGTTTVAVRLYGEGGRLVGEAAAKNPQGSFGADVISRIEASMSGSAEELKSLIVGAVNGLIEKAGCGRLPDALVVTGNTAMLYLLCGTDPSSISAAPFEADVLFGFRKKASDIGIAADIGADIYFPPCISAFVGADTVCAMLASGLCDGAERAMLADIGTNGELALWNGKELYTCSSAAGPAFEGGGISMGMNGYGGAISEVSVSDGGLICRTIGSSPAQGICGSGLIDAASALLTLGTVEPSGYMECDEAVLEEPVTLTRADIRALQLSKSAIAAGMLTLLKKSNIASVDTLYIAGGFGSFLNVESAKHIGLIPLSVSKNVKVKGNAALTGASMLLLDGKLTQKAEALVGMARTIPLSNDPDFFEYYVECMELGPISALPS